MSISMQFIRGMMRGRIAELIIRGSLSYSIQCMARELPRSGKRSIGRYKLDEARL